MIPEHAPGVLNILSRSIPDGISERDALIWWLAKRLDLSPERCIQRWYEEKLHVPEGVSYDAFPRALLLQAAFFSGEHDWSFDFSGHAVTKDPSFAVSNFKRYMNEILRALKAVGLNNLNARIKP
jgi:hypothetical protein